jgi:hypothetical protein
MISYDTIDLKMERCIVVVWNHTLNFIPALQAIPSTDPSLLGILNVLVVFGILCSIAFLVASRRQVRETHKIQGFEFMHEVSPLPLYESREFYYLF